MNQTSNFFRYMLPGLVFLIHIVAAGGIVYTDGVLFYFKGIDASSGVVSIVGLLVGSGGLGYIFSTVYFSLRHTTCLKNCLSWNHRAVFPYLRSKYGYSIKGKQARKAMKTHEGALVVVNHLWYKAMKNNEMMEKHVSNLCDVVHGLGATMVSIVFSALVIGTFLLKSPPVYKIDAIMVAYLTYLLVFFILVVYNYCKLKKHIESQINTSLITSIEECGLNRWHKVVYIK